MDNHAHSRLAGRSLALVALSISAAFATAAHAEAVATVNGVDIEDSTFEFYVESRLQKPLLQVTAEEREAVLSELKDIYVLTTQPRANELAADPRLQAQIELQRRAALAQAVATDWLANNPATDEEIQAAYESQAQLAPDVQFKARHILVETQGAAVDVIASLDAGESFAELAQTHSTGPSGPAGGDLGWFSPNQMVAPFSDAVAALEDGAYTKAPVQTEFGWHVILREESRTSEAPPLDSVRDAVKTNVEQTNFQRYLEGLRAAEEGS
ncbi:MAG: peptidylprolyl isomerase [Woeseiaceae bacterium]